MELLTQLGVNSSLAVQFGIFVVCYGFLKVLLFDPYFAAFTERSNRTVGKTELAEKFIDETKALEKRFAIRAQEVNEHFRVVYDAERAEALREYEGIVGGARVRAQQLIADTAARIDKEVASARQQIQDDVTAVAELVNQKLVGKDVRP